MPQQEMSPHQKKGHSHSMSMGQMKVKVKMHLTCRCLREISCASGSSSPGSLCTPGSCSFLGAGWDLWDMGSYRHTHTDLHRTSCVAHREPVLGDESALDGKRKGLLECLQHGSYGIAVGWILSIRGKRTWILLISFPIDFCFSSFHAVKEVHLWFHNTNAECMCSLMFVRKRFWAEYFWSDF